VDDAATPPASRRIDQPTTVLWGGRDPTFPPAWADNIPAYFPALTAPVRVLPDVGHFLPFEAPEEIAAANRGVI